MRVDMRIQGGRLLRESPDALKAGVLQAMRDAGVAAGREAIAAMRQRVPDGSYRDLQNTHNRRRTTPDDDMREAFFVTTTQRGTEVAVMLGVHRRHFYKTAVHADPSIVVKPKVVGGQRRAWKHSGRRRQYRRRSGPARSALKFQTVDVASGQTVTFTIAERGVRPGQHRFAPMLNSFGDWDLNVPVWMAERMGEYTERVAAAARQHVSALLRDT